MESCPELYEVLQCSDFFSEASILVRSPHMLKNYPLRDPSGRKVGSYSYVSICDVLQKYCSHEDVWDSMQRERSCERDEHVLTDYRDGIYFRNHKVFADNPDALRLHLYEDEFEVCNPLGSKRNKHKRCAFYYTVGNVGSKNCSQLKQIHLALLVRYVHVKKFGLDVILKPLLDDLKKLSSEGLIVNGMEKHVFGAVAAILGDNLSLHMIGGFAMSFGAGRICRYCMATHSEMKKNFSESDFVLRNVDVHRYHLECVKQNPENKGMYGVRVGSVFDQLDYFDVTISLPPDVMHDFLEGVAPLVLRLVVCKAHQEKHITIQELNDELRKMSIG